MLCILYVIAIATLLGVAGLLLEHARPARATRRWIWCVSIALSMTVPPLYQAKHSSSVTGMIGESRIDSFDPIVMKLWILTSALLLVWGLFNAWRVSRIARGGAATVEGIKVVVSDSLGPATVGIWRPRVLLPKWVLAMPNAQRQYVLRHEEEHRRAQDARLLFIASLTLLLTPWNLALWWQLRRLSLAVEMDCDNRVVAALGDATSYGETLFKVAQASNHDPRLQPAFLGGGGALERRLKLLTAPARLPRALRYLLPVLAIGLLFVVLSTPHPVLSSASASASHATHR
jgi:hypothetical protein